MVLAGCGSTPPAGSAGTTTETATGATVKAQAASPSDNLVPAAYDGRFRVFATVLEDAKHGPQLCAGVLTASYPPQCAGPDVIGWDWDAVEHTSILGTNEGSYLVVGTFHGERFTLTEPAVPDDGRIERPAEPFPDLASPCPEPTGGWTPSDRARATHEAVEAAAARAKAVAGFGELWIDQRLSDAELAAAPWTANDPQRVVLNITTTEDIDVMEGTLREVWGGSLCVSRAVRSDAELAPIQEAVVGEPGMLGVGTEHRTGRVVVEVHRATEERQRELDAQYGEGVVRLKGKLIPIDAT